MSTVYIIIYPLENGLTVDQITNLLSKVQKDGEKLFPFAIEQNNSAAFGFIPEHIMDLNEFDEGHFGEFVIEQMDKSFGEEFFTASYSSTINVVFAW